MKYVILTHDLGRPMYFMDHPFPAGFSISTSRERAKVINGKQEALKACEEFTKACGLKCEVEKK